MATRKRPFKLAPPLKPKPPSQLQEGRLVWRNGYAYVCKPGYIRHGRKPSGYVKRADLVLEEKLGRKLEANEIAHHKNHVRSDDHPDNLEAKDFRLHTSDHYLETVVYRSDSKLMAEIALQLGRAGYVRRYEVRMPRDRGGKALRIAFAHPTKQIALLTNSNTRKAKILREMGWTVYDLETGDFLPKIGRPYGSRQGDSEVDKG